MKIKNSIIIFALIMAFQFVVNVQTTSTDSKTKTKVEKVQPADKSATPVKAESVKADETAKTAGCCKGKTETGCTGHKDGSKDCCKGTAKSGEGCKGHASGDGKASGCKGHGTGEGKSSGCQGHSGQTGDAKSSTMQNSTGATGQTGENRSSKGCCHK